MSVDKVTIEKVTIDAGRLVYPLQAVEYERGWGSRPDGYVLFLTSEDRELFLQADALEKSQSAVVPDVYVDYSPVPVTALKREVVFHPHEVVLAEGSRQILRAWI